MLDEKGQLYLTDFGLAGWVGQAELTQDGAVMGTPVYMSPEQARGSSRAVGAAADQYSVGVVFYELLTGHRPFESGSIQVILHNVINTEPPPPSEWKAPLDARLEEICMTALAKHPDDRYPNCTDMAQALRDWQVENQPELPLVLANPSAPRPRTGSVARETHASVAKRTTQSGSVHRPVEEQFAFEPEPGEAGPSRRVLLLAALGLLALPVLGVGGCVLYRTVNSNKRPGERRLKDLDEPDDKE